MNLRNVLRAYSLLRQLNDEESALLQTLRLTNETERALLVETLSDKPQKKSSKKSAGGGGGRSSSKSAKASGMAKTLNDNLSQRRREAMDDITGESKEPPRRCTATVDDGIKRVCMQFADANIHHLRTDPNYHEFESAIASTTAASGGGG